MDNGSSNSNGLCVIRGGCHNNSASDYPASYRTSGGIEDAYSYISFRVALYL